MHHFDADALVYILQKAPIFFGSLISLLNKTSEMGWKKGENLFS